MLRPLLGLAAGLALVDGSQEAFNHVAKGRVLVVRHHADSCVESESDAQKFSEPFRNQRDVRVRENFQFCPMFLFPFFLQTAPSISIS